MTDPADLEMLRARLGFKGTDKDDLLSQALDAAVAAIDAITHRAVDYWRTRPNLVEAVMLEASRYYARLRSPEGVAGWSDFGVTRVMPRDPDVYRLCVPDIDMLEEGVA